MAVDRDVSRRTRLLSCDAELVAHRVCRVGDARGVGFDRPAGARAGSRDPGPHDAAPGLERGNEAAPERKGLKRDANRRRDRRPGSIAGAAADGEAIRLQAAEEVTLHRDLVQGRRPCGHRPSRGRRGGQQGLHRRPSLQHPGAGQGLEDRRRLRPRG